MTATGRPGRTGLYDPAYEHDACGVAFVARLDGAPATRRSRRAIDGAREPRAPRRRRAPTRDTGDGAGILLQLPDEFFRGVARRRAAAARAQYGVAVLLPARATTSAARELEQLLVETRRGRGPARRRAGATCPSTRRTSARPPRAARPCVRQLVVAAAAELAADQDAFERKLYVIRRVAELAAGRRPRRSRASRRARIVYKGMLMAPQLRRYYPDLRDARIEVARWRSSTPASRRTPSRAGSSRTRTG